MNPKLKKLKEKYVSHYNTLIITILNSSKPSKEEVGISENIIKALLEIIKKQSKLIEKLKTSSIIKEECSKLLKSQGAKLNESLSAIKNINKDKLATLRSDFELLYDEEKSFYSEFL